MEFACVQHATRTNFIFLLNGIHQYKVQNKFHIKLIIPFIILANRSIFYLQTKSIFLFLAIAIMLRWIDRSHHARPFIKIYLSLSALCSPIFSPKQPPLFHLALIENNLIQMVCLCIELFKVLKTDATCLRPATRL